MSKAINRTGAHVLDDQGLAGEYFKTLSSGDASKRYFNGEKYQSTLLNRVRLFLTVEDTLKELKQFYPYQELVTKSIDLYQEKKQKYISAGLTTTAISWYYLIYQGFLSINSPKEDLLPQSSINMVPSSKLIDFSGSMSTL